MAPSRLLSLRAKLIIGFSAFAIVIFSARESVATTYELSIYQATPILVWCGIGLLFTISALTFLGTDRPAVPLLGVICSSVLISSVAILRGYPFYGNRDALTHLGILKSLLSGTLAEPLVYPVLHYLAAALSLVTGASPAVALMASLVCFVPTSIIGSYLLTRWITREELPARFAGVLGSFLLPLMSVRLPTIFPIPNTAAAFAFPLVTYGAVRLSRHQPRVRNQILAVALATMGILLHPTLGVSLLCILGTMWFLNYFVETQARYGIGAALAGWALFWVSQFESKLNTFAALWSIKASGVGGDVSAAGSSLSRIGISLVELGVRLAGVKAIVMLSAGILGLKSLIQHIRGKTSVEESRAFALAVTILPLTAAVGIFFVLGISNQWTRYLGLATAIIVPLGAIQIVRFVEFSTPKRRKQLFALGAITLLFAAPAAAVVHPSPYLVRPSQQVTEHQFEGYGFAFEYQPEETEVAGFYTVPRNFHEGYYGVTESRSGMVGEKGWEAVRSDRPPERLSTSFSTAYPNGTLLVVGKSARDIHEMLFKSAVQREQDFAALENNQRSIRVYDSGDVQIYELNATSNQIERLASPGQE